MLMKSALVSLGIAVLLALPAAAGAHDAMHGGAMADAPVDCTKPEAAMHAAMMQPAHAMSGNVDTDTMHAMMAQAHTTMMLARIEMACGNDPKMKAMAKKTYDDTLELFNEFNHPGTEQ
jgi:hypothetical protein